jgi:nucleoid-associated protein YgaU
LYENSKQQLLNMLQQFNVVPSTSVAAPEVVASSVAVANTEPLPPAPSPKRHNKTDKAAAAAPVTGEEKMPVIRLRATNSAPGKYTAIHKVIYGDTLPSLAEKYYGDKSRWLDIYEANTDKIEKGSLQEGQILIIP